MTNLCLIYSTFPDQESARAVAQSLLDAQLVACCNILPGMESHYIWQGKQETSSEVAMLCKTAEHAAAKTMQYIAANHPYETPAILQLPVTNTSEDFLKWVKESVKLGAN